MVLGATPFQMGLLTAVGGAATLLFGLIAGVWVDRVRRRPVMIVADLGRALVIGTIPLAAYFGALRMPQIYAVSAIAGVLTVLFDVAYQSYVPGLVEREDLADANARLALTSSSAEIVGPGLTGILIRTLTAPLAILIDALSFVASAITIMMIRFPEALPAVRHPESRLGKEIREGLVAVWHAPVLRMLAARAVTAGFFFGMIGPLYVLYALRDLGLGPVQLGIVIAVGGVSNFAGNVVAVRAARILGVGRTLLLSSIMLSVAVGLIALARPPLAFAMGCLVAQQLFGDICFSVYNVHELTLRQSIAPERVLGRVNSVMQLVSRGVWPVGAMAGGALAGVAGSRMTLAIAAAGLLLASAWLLARPIRDLRSA
jgi:predicted MFS family arabinose efflux permease